MSPEQIKSHHEKEKSLEKDPDLGAESRKNIENKLKSAEKVNDATDDIEKIRDSIEDTSVSIEKTKIAKTETETEPDHHQPRSSQSLKKKAYKKELKQVQKHLPGPSRAFSKVIHNSAVDTVSEASSKTIARPSGLLGGGVFASFGTLGLYMASRYYGFEYNFFVFIALLVLGFVVGICIEMIVFPLIKRN